MTPSEFEHIAVQLHQKVLKVGLDFFGNMEDAEDISQETMVQLWRYCEHIDAERNVEALAIKIAKNCCVSEWRRRRMNLVYQIPDCSDNSDPQTQLEAEDMQRLLAEAEAQLNPSERKLFNMRYTEELSTEEIAKQTGIPKTSINAMVSTARRKVITALRIILAAVASWLLGLFTSKFDRDIE